MSISTGAADWLNLKALHQYPDMRIALSEGGIAGYRNFLERADFQPRAPQGLDPIRTSAPASQRHVPQTLSQLLH